MKKIEPKVKNRDAFLWTGVALATVAALMSIYFFHIAGPLKALVWLVWLVVSLSLAFFTDKGKQIVAFANDAITELKKVIWPTRQETVQTTSIVMLMVGLTGFVLWGVDSVMMWAIGKITHLG
jgi:preprotein translocase subunit SecE